MRGSGGLVSALLGVKLEQPFYWIGFETDEKSAKQLEEKSGQINPHLRLKAVVLSKKLYDSYYDRFANDVLWPLFHYEGQHVFFHREHWESYVQANQRMADAILEVANDGDSVWIHDFHFMLLPEMLKQARPSLDVGFFLHTPFPSSEIFRQLPVREHLLKAMTYCNLIGFHEHSYLRHFTVSLKAHLGIDSSFFRAELGGHTLQLGVYPISIDDQSLKAKSLSPEVTELTAEYRRKIGAKFLILGVDRLDYTKGLELKLRGFRRLLQKYPELQGQVSLLQVAVPTRTKVPSYIRLKREIDQLVGTINGEFGKPGYTPVDYIFNSVSEADLLALYRRAECLLVTSKRDGMNLVAMEYAVTQDEEHPGSVVLSEFAGAASLLGEALFINPWDEDSIADALHRSYVMPAEERAERSRILQNILSKYSATQWAQGFLRDLDKTAAKASRRQTTLLLPRTGFLEIAERVKQAPRVRIMLDYDGTLVPLQKRPELAVLTELFRENLLKLNKVAPVHILSGRTKDFLDRQFPDAPFPLAAEHGAFYKHDGEWRSRITSDLRSWMSEVKRVMSSYTEYVPFSFVEQKEAALTWHFRVSPEDFASYQARKLDEELQVGLANAPVSVTMGSKIVEAKAIECDKGSYLRWLLEEDNDESLFICIGDDRTDEDMFRALGQRGISIKVGEGSTTAGFRVGRQEDVLPLLNQILHWRTEKPSSQAEPSPEDAQGAETITEPRPGRRGSEKPASRAIFV